MYFNSFWINIGGDELELIKLRDMGIAPVIDARIKSACLWPGPTLTFGIAPNLGIIYDGIFLCIFFLFTMNRARYNLVVMTETAGLGQFPIYGIFRRHSGCSGSGTSLGNWQNTSITGACFPFVLFFTKLLCIFLEVRVLLKYSNF